jgi:cytochrome P450
MPFILELAHDRRARPARDVLSQLIGESIDGDTLTDVELIAMITFAVTAGYETTANTLTNGIYWLLRNPEQWERVQREPELIPTATEEIIRYDVATRAAGPRFAVDDTELGGMPIRRGDMVKVCIHAANHDPAVFERPDEFEVDRSPNPHLSFATGPHVCLGNALARVEIQSALEAILERLPGLRLAGEAEWQSSFVIRGLKALPVTWSG